MHHIVAYLKVGVHHIVAYFQVGVYHMMAYLQIGVYHIVASHNRHFIKKLSSRIVGKANCIRGIE